LLKVLVKLFQKLVGSKGNALAARRNERNSLCFKKRRKVVKKTLAGGFLKCEAPWQIDQSIDDKS